MMNRHIAHNLTATLATIEKLGGKVAPAARKKIDAALAAVRRVETWRPEGGNLRDTVAAALAAGKDPASDEAVLRAIVGERVLEAREGVIDTAGRALADVVREHLDGLVDAFRKPYREAGDRLTAARTVLAASGIGYSTEPSIILGAGPEASTAWADATAALAVLNKIQTQLGSLYVVLGVSLAEPSLAWFDPVDLDLYEVRALGRSMHPWQVLDAGATLELGSPTQCLERMQRAGEAVEAKAQKERRDAAQRPSYAPKAVVG